MAKKGKKNNQGLWIGLGIIVIIVIALFFMFDVSDLKKLIPGGGEEESFNAETYYADLEAGCDDLLATQRGCCVISANIMKKGGFKLADDEECDAGFEANTFSCPGAHTWCEPVD